MSEIQTLRRRWSKADNGNPMPEDIARQPIELIRKAVGWRERNHGSRSEEHCDGR